MTAKIFAPDSVRTLAEAERTGLQVAAVLGELGIGAGDRVVLKAGNSAHYVTVLLGLIEAGASIVLVDQGDSLSRTEEICRLSGAKLSLVDDDATYGGEAVFLDEIHAAAAGRVVEDRPISFETWGERPDGLVLWTSGSTGTPKGVVKSGGRFLRNVERHLAHVGYREDDVILPLLPFAHQYGFSMLLAAFVLRCSLVVAPYRRLDRALRFGAICGTTVVEATPATYHSILRLGAGRPELRQCVERARMTCAGAASLEKGLSDRYVAEFGRPLLDSYGSTELGNVAFASPGNPVHCGLPLPGVSLRIVGEGSVPLAAVGEVGEIEADSPDAMTGTIAEDGSLIPFPDGWYRTGDLGRIDEHGNVSVLGRKLAVNRMGYTIYPEAVERKAEELGCSVKIVSRPDERGGAQLIFFVADDQRREPRYWRDLLTVALPVYEQPNRVHVLDSFPLTRNGKTDKKKLAELAEQG